MNYIHRDLRWQRAGTVVAVTLNIAANVQLLNPHNFAAYHAGRDYQGYGGHYTQTPVRIAIPSDGNWHVAVDLGGYAGYLKASIDVLPPFAVAA